MKILSKLLVFFIICNLGRLVAQTQVPHNIIPQPVSVRSAPGNLKLLELKQIVIPKKSIEFRNLAEYIKNALNMPDLKIIESKSPSLGKTKSIVISLLTSEKNKDNYALNINKNGILINAEDSKGAFYAIQSVLQLSELSDVGSIPFYIIEDESEFKYRGMHLDVSRHFFSVSFIKLYIDLLARYKFNTFHWHLTDDQGWRIEIKKFPDLTEIGSKRKETLIGAYGSSPVQYDNTEYGGFYTQEEIRDVVSYASARYIEIIPEIEMPGHSAALLASYPQYSCSEGTREVATTWGVMNNVICPTDTSLWFMKEILDEVCDLFPGKYIHIGGDEVSKDEWKKSDACTKIMLRQNLKNYDELQSYFIKQINFFLTKKGKILIGWDEILEGGLSQNAVVMSWRGVDGGLQAARQKHEVIMTPGTHCYFDHYQSISNQEPLAIGGFTSLEKAYSFNPIPDGLQPEFKKYILGAQGNVWTEYMSTPEQVLYMAFPRAIALSEVTWTSKEKRNYTDFVQRLNQHIKWFKANNINISTAFLDLSYRTYSSPEGVQLVFNKAPVKGQILVETNSVEEGINQEYLSSDTMLLQHDMEFKSWYQLPDNRLGRSLSLAYKHHKFTGKTVSYSQNPSTKYSSGGLNSIVNGIDAPINKFSGPEWIGFDEGNNMEAIIENSDTLNMITVQLFQEESSWVYLPQSIEVYSSDDNITYQLEGKNMLGLMPGRGITQSIKFSTPVMKRYIKVLIQNHGMIEEGRPGAGHGAWLFVGELKAE